MRSGDFKLLNVLFASAIDQASLKRFYRKVVPRLEKTDLLNLYIDSAGGQVVVALGLARFLASLGKKVVTFNVGHCDSAAIVLFAAGHGRIANAEGCRFLMHEVGFELSGVQTLTSLAKIIRQLRRDTERICSFLEKRTGRSATLWERDMKKGRSLSPKSAQRRNLATGEAEVRLPKRMLTI